MNIVKKLYEEKKYSELCDTPFERKLTEEETYYCGKAFLEIGYAKNCIILLSQMNKICLYCDIPRYLGIAYFMIGEYRESEKNFLKKEQINEIEKKKLFKWNKLLCLNNKDVCIINTKNIIFHFIGNYSDSIRKDIILQYKKNYEFLNNLFRIKFQKKIDLYIHKTNIDLCGNMLCYANQEILMIQINWKVVGAHELAHVFLHYLYDDINKSRFIDEGFATYYDNENYILSDCSNVKGPVIFKNIIECWENFEYYPQSVANYYAGIFYGFILKKYGFERMKKFLRDQTVDNAIKVFGANFYNDVEEFNLIYLSR